MLPNGGTDLCAEHGTLFATVPAGIRVVPSCSEVIGHLLSESAVPRPRSTRRALGESNQMSTRKSRTIASYYTFSLPRSSSFYRRTPTMDM